ncbi:ABC transporter substrate-binding protein [Photobacterium damselae]|uniref:ABC transporter substrate-binding protein n=1 Tax=Photobacterium damselae TaxID=38293 RepID=UPI0040694311
MQKILTSCFLSLSLSVSISVHAQVPDTLYVALGDEPTAGFDPIMGWGKYGNPLFQSTLLKRNQQLEFVGDLAKDWTLSHDRKTWSVELRNDVKFSNGQPLTAKDVAFTFNQAKQALSSHDLTDLESITVLDPTHIEFHLTKPNITFLDHFSAIGIVPEKEYVTDTKEHTNGYGRHPIGSGPYILQSWQQGQFARLEKNPFYYGKQPQFEHLVLVFASEETRYGLLKTKQVQLAAIPQQFAKVLPVDYRLWQVASVDNRGVVWPMNKPSKTEKGNCVSSSLAIREAVDMVIDKQLIVDTVMDGFARPAYSVADNMPWGLPAADRKQPLDNSSAIAAAQSLLDKAGWKVNADSGLREKEGVPAVMTLYYKAGDSVREQLALTVAQMVKPLGISMSVKGADWDTIAGKMLENPVLMGFGSHSANEVRYLYHSDYAAVDFYNSGQYRNSVVDNDIDKALQATSWQASLPFWLAAEKQIVKDQPWTWLVNLQHLYAASTCLDLGQPITEPHGHGWPITENIEQWRWTCQ